MWGARAGDGGAAGRLAAGRLISVIGGPSVGKLDSRSEKGGGSNAFGREPKNTNRGLERSTGLAIEPMLLALFVPQVVDADGCYTPWALPLSTVVIEIGAVSETVATCRVS